MSNSSRKPWPREEYFRLVDPLALPILNPKASRYTADQSPEKTAERIIKSQHFLYIDLDEGTYCLK